MMKISDYIKPLGWLLLYLTFFTSLYAQETELRLKMHGKVIDSRTKKGIKKIPIKVLPFNRVIEADNYGAFLFNMPKGSYSIVLDYSPFIKQEVFLNLQSDTTLVIELHSISGSVYLGEVEVISSKPATDTPASIEQLDSRQLKTIPALMGERDILKAFRLTPGVTSSSEGAADMQVRGGLHGQNLYLLDGIPLYSTEHFFGLVSVYNPTIIKNATLYKSAFPAEYGGKISSVINVQSEDANLKKFNGEAEIGLLTSKLALTIPLVKDKLALSVAGRLSNYSILDLISPILPEETGTRFSVHFGDINANLFWKLSEKNKLKLTFLSNTDGIEIQNIISNQKNKFWNKNNQQNLGLNWYKTISEKAENHLLIYVDNYGYDLGNSIQDIPTNQKQIAQVVTGINSMGLVDKINFIFSDKLYLNTGVSVKSYGFSPFQINANDSNLNIVKPTDQIRLSEGVVFAESEYQLAKKQNLTVGLRFSGIGNQNITYTNLEPRIGYHGIFASDYSLSSSIGRMTQPIHRVANSGLGFPFEMFYPSGSTLKPESSWNFSLGGAKDFSWNNSKFSLKVDTWYKTIENMVEFQDGYDVSYITNFAMQTNTILNTNKFLTQGKEKAYGIDFSANYTIKNIRLTACYTLMKAECLFDKLNNGRPFAAQTDIRNSLSLNTEIKLSESWSFSAIWQYNSGKPITVPTYIFVNPTFGKPRTSNFNGIDYQQVVTDRNNYRTKPFHRLDFSFNHNYKTRRSHYDASFSLGIYNVYSQANPFIYYVDVIENSDKTYTPVLKSMSLFPILPSFNWSVKF